MGTSVFKHDNYVIATRVSVHNTDHHSIKTIKLSLLLS